MKRVSLSKRSGGVLSDWRAVRKVLFLPSPLVGEGGASPSEATGERLSEESSCIGVLGTRIACFCVEADEQFVGESDPDDHFGFSCGEQSVAEGGKGLVVFSGDGGDQEEDRTDSGAAAADRSLALPLTTVIGERGEAGEFGNGLVGVGADLRHVCHQASAGAPGTALHRPPACAGCAHRGSSSIIEAISPSRVRDCRLSRVITSPMLASISALSARLALL